MFKLDSKDSITKSIASIGRAGVRLIAAIQVAAVQVIAHATKHGDVSLANALIDATPKHQRASLVAFLETYGPFAYMKVDKKLAFFKNAKVEQGKDLTQEYVDSLPRWETMVKPPEPKSVYNAGEEFDRLITRMRKLASTTGVEVKDKALIDEMAAAYNRYQAKLVLGDAADNATGENVQFQKPALAA
jgi:hypothetical protein